MKEGHNDDCDSLGLGSRSKSQTTIQDVPFVSCEPRVLESILRCAHQVTVAWPTRQRLHEGVRSFQSTVTVNMSSWNREPLSSGRLKSGEGEGEGERIPIEICSTFTFPPSPSPKSALVPVTFNNDSPVTEVLCWSGYGIHVEARRFLGYKTRVSLQPGCNKNAY